MLSDALLAALVPLALAVLVVGIPVLGQLLPVELREKVFSPRVRGYRNAAITALMGLTLALQDGLKALRGPIDGGDLAFTIVGGALLGLGLAQAMAATNVNLLIPQPEPK